jgi:hypothetical protein
MHIPNPIELRNHSNSNLCGWKFAILERCPRWNVFIVSFHVIVFPSLGELSTQSLPSSGDRWTAFLRIIVQESKNSDIYVSQLFRLSRWTDRYLQLMKFQRLSGLTLTWGHGNAMALDRIATIVPDRQPGQVQVQGHTIGLCELSFLRQRKWLSAWRCGSWK